MGPTKFTLKKPATRFLIFLPLTTPSAGQIPWPRNAHVSRWICMPVFTFFGGVLTLRHLSPFLVSHRVVAIRIGRMSSLSPQTSAYLYPYECTLHSSPHLLSYMVSWLNSLEPSVLPHWRRDQTTKALPAHFFVSSIAESLLFSSWCQQQLKKSDQITAIKKDIICTPFVRKEIFI